MAILVEVGVRIVPASGVEIGGAYVAGIVAFGGVAFLCPRVPVEARSGGEGVVPAVRGRVPPAATNMSGGVIITGCLHGFRGHCKSRAPLCQVIR